MLGGRGHVCNQDMKIISFLRLIWLIWHEHSVGEKELRRSFVLLGNTVVEGVACMAH